MEASLCGSAQVNEMIIRSRMLQLRLQPSSSSPLQPLTRLLTTHCLDCDHIHLDDVKRHMASNRISNCDNECKLKRTVSFVSIVNQIY